MKKTLTLLTFLLALAVVVFAQDGNSTSSSGFDKSKLFVGGNLGLAFGTYTIVNVSPLVGYRFNELFAAGVGVNYSYYGYSDAYWNYKQSYAGISIFGRLYPIQQFFIQVQPELNYMWYSQTAYGSNSQDIPSVKLNQFVPSLLMGGGAAIPTGANGAITISVMYDVLQNVYSPYYHQAVYGFGYTVGF